MSNQNGLLWLVMAYEAALLLRDRSGVPKIKSKWLSFSQDDMLRQEKNRQIGAKVVKDLEERFPQLKDNDAKESKQIST